MISKKYYPNTVTLTSSKHTARDLSCCHINITFTQLHVPSVNTQIQSCNVIIFIYIYYLNTVKRTVRKHTARALSCYRINIRLTQSNVLSVNTELKKFYIIIYTYIYIILKELHALSVNTKLESGHFIT